MILYKHFEKTPLSLEVNTHRSKLKDLVDKIVKSKLGMNLPLIIHGSGLLYEVDDDLEEDMLANNAANFEKVLSELAINGGTMIIVEDLRQELVCNINMKHREEFDEEKELDGMVFHGWTQAPAVESNKNDATNNGASTSSTSASALKETEEDDDLTVLDAGIKTISVGKKRKLSDISNPETPALSDTNDEKRIKKIPEQFDDDGDAVVMLDGDAVVMLDGDINEKKSR